MKTHQWNRTISEIAERHNRYILIHAAFLEEDGTPNYIYKAHLDKAIELYKEDPYIKLVLVAGLHKGESFRQDIAGVMYLLKKGVSRSSIICLDDLGIKGANITAEEIKIFKKIIEDKRKKGVFVKSEAITNSMHWGRIFLAYRKLIPNIRWQRAPLETKLSNVLNEAKGYALSYLLLDPLQEGYIANMAIRSRQGLDPIPNRTSFTAVSVLVAIGLSLLAGWIAFAVF